MPNKTDSPKPGKKRRRVERRRAQYLKWTYPQIPSENYINFETTSENAFNTVIENITKTVSPKSEIEKNKIVNPARYPIENSIPPQRVDVANAKIKEKVIGTPRNIHVLIDRTLVQSEQKKKKKSVSVIMNHPKEKNSVSVVMNRPKGIPVTFLARQENQNAIMPQNVELNEGLETTTLGQVTPYGQAMPANPSLQPMQMQGQPNQTFVYPTQMQIFDESQMMGQLQMMGHPQMVGQQQLMMEQSQMIGQQTQIIGQPSCMIGQQPLMIGQSSSMISQPSQWTGQQKPMFSQSIIHGNPLPPIQVDSQKDSSNAPREQYSPSDVYENNQSENESEISSSSDALENKQKRKSAFERLGPQKAKTPKLTINLCLKKNQPVREVVEESEIPVYERDEIMTSMDPIVAKFRYHWPWKNNIPLRRSVTMRSSKTVMMLEREQVEEEYKNDNLFMIVSVTGFPPSWSKENVLDAILETLKDNSFIPCFIEFNKIKCKFLVNRCRPALLALHYQGFSIRKGDVELMIMISVTILNTRALEYIPRLIIRNRLAWCCNDGKADLKEFTLKSDISNFIYFPLNRPSNQGELMELLKGLEWESLRELDLSYNRLTTIENFGLLKHLPRLQHLNLSYNLLDSIKTVLPLRGLLLKTLSLEGNPLCLNYIDGDYYIKVVRTIFPSLKKLDGVSIQIEGEIPEFKRNYCFKDAQPVAEKFVSTYFRTLDLEPEKRKLIENMYHKNALLTVTSRNKLRYDQDYDLVRHLFLRSRGLEEGNYDFVQGSEKITNLIYIWPHLRHDLHSISVDVMMHTETSTLLRVNGIVSTRSASLADEEKLLAFTRTILLKCEDDIEYKIMNEMLYWDEVTKECAENAFKVAIIQNKTFDLKFDTPLDDECKNRLINIFSKLTGLDSSQSLRYLEEKDWDIKLALQYFMKLLKLDNVEFIKS